MRLHVAALAALMGARPAIPAAAAPAAARMVDARVLLVAKAGFPEVKLVLAVTRRGKTVRLEARPVYVRVRGRVRDWANPINVRDLQAYYLQPGDPIRGRLTQTPAGWVLSDLERRPVPPPHRAAALEVELRPDRARVPLGAKVGLSLRLVNYGGEAELLNFPTAQRYEFQVLKNGRVIWRSSQGRVYAQMTSSMNVLPGDTVLFRDVWEQQDADGDQVPPGTYRVEGWITATGQAELTRSSAVVTIDLPPASLDGPMVSDIEDNPRLFLNRQVTLTGVYRGRDASETEPLLRGGPPFGRRDWVLQDASGGIWVSGNGGLRLNPDSDMDQPVRVHGLLRQTPSGRVYVRAWETRRITGQ